MTTLEAARLAYAAGLSILPVKDDGSKAPAGPSWEQYKHERPTQAEMRAWGFEYREGFGMVAGPVSGYRETWDFDCPATFTAYVEAANQMGLGDVVQRIRDGYEDRTPSGGVRWIATYPQDVVWTDETYARRPGRDGEPKIKTLIETTTFAVLAPSNGRTHPSGGAYVRVSGGFPTIATYTAGERDALIALARSFDAMPRKAAEPRPTAQRAAAGDRPGDDFNARADWHSILTPHGWQPIYERGEVTHWTRPGKDHGVSATTNVHGSDLLWCFSSSTAFEPEKSYSKFGAFAVLEHAGDFRKAALALSKLGYGEQDTPAFDGPQNRPHEPQTAPSFAQAAITEGLGQCVLGPLVMRPYSGWFARGAVHLIAGSSGAGKTTLTLDLLRMQARRAPYLGHPGAGLEFLVLFADRGAVSNRETLERMKIDPATLPLDHLPPTTDGAAALQAVREAVERCPECPAVVFVEGADLLVEDPCKTQVVTPFVVGLRQLAEHYSLAIILSVGAPKSRPQEQYQLKRDQVFGSQAWSRLCNTVLVLTTTGDGTVATRDLAVLHRNAAAEIFHLTFTDGLLVEAAPSTVTEPDMLTWFREVEVFTKQKFRDAFTLSGARATTLLDGYVAIGRLREKVKNDRTVYVYKHPAVLKFDRSSEKTDGQSDSDSDTARDAIRTEISVRKTIGHGHENEGSTFEFANDSATNGALSLIPPKTPSVVHSGHSSLDTTDDGHGFRGYTRAHETEGDQDDLPACLAELTEPDFSDPIGAHDEDDDEVRL